MLLLFANDISSNQKCLNHMNASLGESKIFRGKPSICFNTYDLSIIYSRIYFKAVVVLGTWMYCLYHSSCKCLFDHLWEDSMQRECDEVQGIVAVTSIRADPGELAFSWQLNLDFTQLSYKDFNGFYMI